MADTQLVHFNCPRELLREFDELIGPRYGDRTNALQDAMRKLVKELKEA